MRCPHDQSCSLTTRISMNAALRVWQSFYCEGSFGRCERYKLHSSGASVPERLLPNGRMLDLPLEAEPAPSRRGAI
jgi:hypothetical protein